MSGKLYGIGIGPGDPELITIKAKKILDKARVIAFPGKVPKETEAYKIISRAVDLSGKQLIGLGFPMTKDKKILNENHREGAEKIRAILEQDIDVVFPTLGDPGIYATYIYIHKIIAGMGYETEIVPGITSFCAAAAKINEALTEAEDELHVIPSSYGVEKALTLKGTKVLMKSGGQFKKVLRKAKETGQRLWVLENIGMENERISFDPEEDTEAGYYTLIIVKGGRTVE